MVSRWPRKNTVSGTANEIIEYHFTTNAGDYKPILEEVEKILAEAGLDEDEIRKGASAGGGPSTQSRNRR